MNSNVIEDFEKELGSGKGEQAAQNFIETHTDVFFPPHLLNHRVHLDLLISKFKLDTTLVTDFAYLTKSSAEWYVVLVELEDPAKQLFTKNANSTAELTAAIQQVRSWRSFVQKNTAEVLRRIAPLKKPLQWNQVSFRYALVIGRTGEFAADQRKLDAFEQLQQADFRVLTYDSLISAYRRKPNDVLDVVSQSREKFTFKYRHTEDTDIFEWLSPNDFDLDEPNAAYFKSRGYDIESWSAGKRLSVNRKVTSAKFLDAVSDALVAAKRADGTAAPRHQAENITTDKQNVTHDCTERPAD